MANNVNQGQDLIKQFGPGDVLNGKGVNYTPAQIDQPTQELMSGLVNRASAPQSEFISRQNAGINAAAEQAFQRPDQIQNQGAQSGTGNSAQLNAIRNKYNQYAQKDIQSLETKNRLNAPLQQANWLSQAAKVAMAKQQVATNNYSMLVQAYNDAQAARAQTLSSLMQLGGAAGGVAMANRNRSNGSRPQRVTGGSYNGEQMAGGYGDSMSNGYNGMDTEYA